MAGNTKTKTKEVSTGVSPTPAADRTKDLKDYPFLVKVLVTYTKLNEQSNETRFKDEVVFKLDGPSARMPWYVLRNYTVPKYLTSKYGPEEVGWQRIYEIKIVKLINRVDPENITDIPLRVMTLGQLTSYCKRWDLVIDVHEFYSVEKAREMVALRQQDEKGYEKHLAEYRAGKQRSYPELDNMRGDKEAAVADTSEFSDLEKSEPQVSMKKKAVPTAEIAPSLVEKELLDDKESGTKEVPADPFAGV